MKDKFALGEKLYAFNVNSIVQAIQDLSKNIADLEGSSLRYISKTASGQTTATVPKDCNTVLIKACYNFPTAGGGALYGDLILTRVGKTTGSVSNEVNSGSYLYSTATADWSGDTITMTGGTGEMWFYK